MMDTNPRLTIQSVRGHSFQRVRSRKGLRYACLTCKTWVVFNGDPSQTYVQQIAPLVHTDCDGIPREHGWPHNPKNKPND